MSPVLADPAIYRRRDVQALPGWRGRATCRAACARPRPGTRRSVSAGDSGCWCRRRRSGRRTSRVRQPGRTGCRCGSGRPGRAGIQHLHGGRRVPGSAGTVPSTRYSRSPSYARRCPMCRGLRRGRTGPAPGQITGDPAPHMPRTGIADLPRHLSLSMTCLRGAVMRLGSPLRMPQGVKAGTAGQVHICVIV